MQMHFPCVLLDFLCIYVSVCLFQAWLTEIHEYAQSDVVIMLLGNKVRGNSLRKKL